MLQRHGNAEHRKAVGKICRAVERVDVPTIFATGIDQALLLAQDIMAWPLLLNALPNQHLGVTIRHRDQVRLAFVLNFHLHLLAKILHQQSARFASDLRHSWDKASVVRLVRGHLG